MRGVLIGSIVLLGAAIAACGGGTGSDVLNGGPMGAHGSLGVPNNGTGGSAPGDDAGAGSSGGNTGGGNTGGSTGSAGDDAGTGIVASADAGGPVPDAATSPASDGGNPFGVAAVCTSNTHWAGGNNGSTNMRPGAACIACHSQSGAPSYLIAGTVYPTGHEPNDCNGESGISIVVTDANGQTVTIAANSVGNFHYSGALTPPFKVATSANGQQRAMIGTVTNGDCNSCHTQTGASGAPGRIVGP